MAMAKYVGKWFLAACSVVLVSACGSNPVTAKAEVAGSAMYRERIALPEGAEFEATLVDVSRVDVAADVIGDVHFAAPAGPPIQFRIPYDPSRIDATHRYAVRARIVLQEQVLFTTDTAYPVLTQGAPATVEVLLRKAGAGTARSAASPGPTVLHGMYTHMADAGWFTECEGERRRLPVAQEGDNAALEVAYAKAPHDPNAPLRVAVKGRIEDRVPMEGAARPTLIVDKFLGIKAMTCEGGGVASLENTYWKVISIRGVSITVSERQREPNLILHPADHRVTGHGGCNSMMGSYQSEGERITFSKMAGTMMACPSGMDQEQAMHQALGTVVRWHIDGQKLELLNGKGAIVLELESRYLK